MKRRTSPQVPTKDPGGRVARALRRLDLGIGPGLEIGALYSPMVRKSEADVCYVDVDTTENLRHHYATHPGVPAGDIVGVDVPLRRDGRVRSLPEALGDRTTLASWVVASHVVEHVPDLIGWFTELADVMADDARLALVIPDRRYSFDAQRPATTVGQALMAHEGRDRQPSLRAVFDHHFEAVHVAPSSAWRGELPGPAGRVHDFNYVLSQIERQRAGDYIDCHLWLFTPGEFIAQLEVFARLGLLNFVVDDVLVAAVDDLEFFVTLRRLPRTLTEQQRREAHATGFAFAAEHMLMEPGHGGTGVPLAEGARLEVVSRLEWTVIKIKRAVLSRLHR